MSAPATAGRPAADPAVHGGPADADDLVARALAALRAGRPVLVADGEDREDEVDVVLAAAHATEHWVGWTVRHTSGYLCAPLPAERADDLELPLMVARSQDPRGTAYTVSVDAARGVGTGISAADRAATLRTLADTAAGPGDLIRPGHVLPLRAVPGGVLARPGHTEAAVDLCRLAGVAPVAAIAELVEDDGTMTRRRQAAALADREDLVLLTIADVVAHVSGARAEETRRPRRRPGHDHTGTRTPDDPHTDTHHTDEETHA
ncbi:3,4-dihydroxy 2-butanone 4-phosphate synthase/GTP cyclohydrolase II [Georgenia muralis]|uniref:3,4-dihydroxy-2-butanone 4-phosphate synthase n=1 Tax=Georgenia muralis TaxID=154117 RepID=A0A3N4Z816_9MICO|nr:3,4-dihydroxy 2-butanone 4-phosphate synthase/GTP cyclohydrolase II [Georgenia muralis]